MLDYTPRRYFELSSNVNIILASSNIAVRVVDYTAPSFLKRLLHLFNTFIARSECVLIDMNITSCLEMAMIKGCFPKTWVSNKYYKFLFEWGVNQRR